MWISGLRRGLENAPADWSAFKYWAETYIWPDTDAVSALTNLWICSILLKVKPNIYNRTLKAQCATLSGIYRHKMGQKNTYMYILFCYAIKNIWILTFYSPMISIYIYIRGVSTCKEAAILSQVSTVARNVDLVTWFGWFFWHHSVCKDAFAVAFPGWNFICNLLPTTRGYRILHTGPLNDNFLYPSLLLRPMQKYTRVNFDFVCSVGFTWRWQQKQTRQWANRGWWVG